MISTIILIVIEIMTDDDDDDDNDNDNKVFQLVMGQVWAGQVSSIM